MKEIVFATGNSHKLRELGQMLSQLDVRVFSSKDFPALGEIEETGASFEENALLKARQTALHTQKTCIADDSGLEVEALNGQPGIYSARFAGPDADDRKNNRKLLEMLEGLEPEKRRARFVCTIAICNPDGKSATFSGYCPGTILTQEQGENGFGYDPLFVPDGFNQTFAQIPAQEKNSISHRANALKLLKDNIDSWLE